ncbi:MAG TPA: prepilin-type N-terminal cleavage/methylation domain-containing protein, partial [Myxococcales bacterium]|nr:prepilin-type N-terminal cleavage/methylation domain-containing protein [Myxococcales bacterium]
MRPRRRGPARGFTLIELLVGSAVVLVILTGAAAVLLSASSQHRRALEKSNLERASMLLIGQMQAELRQAGLGMPNGSSSLGNRFPASIFAANPGTIAFIADLARPNSGFNGISQLSDDQVTIGPNGVAILNELSGTCAVDVLSPHCLTDQVSALFNAGPDCTANQGAPTCPWSLQKYQPAEWILMANGAGSWLEKQLPIAPPVFGSFGGRFYLAVQGGRPLTFFANLPNRGFI